MKFKGILLTIVFVAFAFMTFASGENTLYIEIRCPKGIEIKSNTGQYSGLNFRTDHTTEGTPLSLTEQREDGEFMVFQQSYKLKNEHSRAVIITPWNQKDQVFLLFLPIKPAPADWTKWRHPNYVETNAVSNFRFDYTPPDRSTNIPPNSFELRYKIE